MGDDSLYLGTSIRGITKEIEILVPWGKVAGKIYGDSNGSPVLCIHGWLDNCNTFDTLLSYLPKDRFYVLIDLPGHGKSSAIPIGSFYSMYDSIALVDRIRRHFSWSHFSLLGHSLGGNISALYSGTFPEKVDKLIIIDVIGVYVMPSRSDVENLRSAIESYAKYEEEIGRTPRSYTYDEAREKLLGANKSLTGHAADVLLERGAIQQADGTYVFARDFRHNYRNSSMIDMDKGLDFLKKIQAETIHIFSDNGLVKRILKALDHTIAHRIFSEGFQACEYHKRVDVPGMHHVHLCNPQNVSDSVNSILNRPIRAGILEASKQPGPNL